MSASSVAVKPVSQLSWSEKLNFLITNRIPRRWLTLLVGRLSRVESRWFARNAIRVWQWFVDDLRLDEAQEQEFDSLRDCFTRQLRAGARPVAADPQILTSPCDAVVGEFGATYGLQAIQAKGFPYSIVELLGDGAAADRYCDGRFITLRLKSSMYHRFHAPCDAAVKEVRYISGDTWNVNPVALKTIERLFCRNERAVLRLYPTLFDENITLVPIAAILVASMRIHGLAQPLNLLYQGPNDMQCKRRVAKGDELGYFEQGSTIVMFTSSAFRFVDTLRTGKVIRMGQPLMQYIHPLPERGDK